MNLTTSASCTHRLSGLVLLCGYFFHFLSFFLFGGESCNKVNYNVKGILAETRLGSVITPKGYPDLAKTGSGILEKPIDVSASTMEVSTNEYFKEEEFN